MPKPKNVTWKHNIYPKADTICGIPAEAVGHVLKTKHNQLSQNICSYT